MPESGRSVRRARRRGGVVHRPRTATNRFAQDPPAAGPYSRGETSGADMGSLKAWSIGVAVVGTVAGLMAAVLLWLLVTHHVVAAQAMAKGF